MGYLRAGSIPVSLARRMGRPSNLLTNLASDRCASHDNAILVLVLLRKSVISTSLASCAHKVTTFEFDERRSLVGSRRLARPESLLSPLVTSISRLLVPALSLSGVLDRTDTDLSIVPHE